MIRAALATLVVALLAAGAASPATRTRCPNETGFAHLAYIEAGALIVLDMPACGGRVLVARGARGGVRWSPDGKYVAFSGGVVAADGRRVFRRLSGTWGPRGHVLARTTSRGGLLLQGPGRPTRRLLPDGWGAASVAWGPTGDVLAVARSRSRTPPREEIWLYRLETGATQLVAGPFPIERLPVLAGISPRSDWVLWWSYYDHAASANADGVPLLAKRLSGGAGAVRVAARMLAADEFLSWCGRRLVAVAGGDRYTTHGKRLVAAGPPLWRPRSVSRDARRSWTSASCSPDGRRLAVSAGRNWIETRFGLERRSIWTMSSDGGSRRRLTQPPRGFSDELPRWAANGRAVFFVRSGPTSPNAQAGGALYVVSSGGGPAKRLSDLGRTSNYYGRYGWAYQTDLFVPRQPR